MADTNPATNATYKKVYKPYYSSGLQGHTGAQQIEHGHIYSQEEYNQCYDAQVKFGIKNISGECRRIISEVHCTNKSPIRRRRTGANNLPKAWREKYNYTTTREIQQAKQNYGASTA